MQRLMAASLWSAPDGLISHATAATLWRFDDVVTDEIHVTTPMTRHLRAEGLSLHRVANLLPADRSCHRGVALTSPLRTAVDLAAVLDPAVLEVAIESALRRRLFSVRQLRWRAEALMGTGRVGSAALRRLLESRELGRSESAPEVEVARMLAAAGLGEPVRQYEIRVDGRLVARVDLAYTEARLVIEYDSDAWHTGVTHRHRDADRRNRLRALGWTVIEVTPATLRDPGSFVALVRSLVLAS
jgi:very-short-patch-repair endonuclease